MALFLECLGALMLALLLLPYSVGIESRQGSTRISFAVVGLRFPGSAEARPEGRVTSKPKEQAVHGGRARRRGPPMRKVKALLLSRDFLPSLARLARRLARHLRPRHLRLRLSWGLGDPFDTGRLLGALAPFLVMLASLEADEVRVEPDFLNKTWELDLSTEIRIVPGVVLLLLSGYLFTRAPWRALVRTVRA